MGREGYIGLPLPGQYGGSSKGIVDIAILLDKIVRISRSASSAYYYYVK
jgi:hypothetical protein